MERLPRVARRATSRPRRRRRSSTATTASATCSSARDGTRARRSSTGSCARSATRSPTCPTCCARGPRRTTSAGSEHRSADRAPAGSSTATSSSTRYAELSGRDVSDLGYWMAFNAWRSAAIGEGVYRRYIDGKMGALPDDVETYARSVERGRRSRPRRRRPRLIAGTRSSAGAFQLDEGRAGCERDGLAGGRVGEGERLVGGVTLTTRSARRRRRGGRCPGRCRR